MAFMNSLTSLVGTSDIALLIIVTVTFVIAGLVKGVVGLGLPTVAVGLLSVRLSPAEAASILLVPSLVTNIWQLAAGPEFKQLIKRLWPMLVMSFLGTVIGGAYLPINTSQYATAALGTALMIYAALGLASYHITVNVRSERWLSPLIGIVTGLVTSATGVFVIPAVPYLQGLGLGKDQLVQALGLAFTISTIALGTSLAFGNIFEPDVAQLSLFALAPALFGMFMGQILRSRIQPEAFRKYFFLSLLALGLHLSLKPFLN